MDESAVINYGYLEKAQLDHEKLNELLVSNQKSSVHLKYENGVIWYLAANLFFYLWLVFYVYFLGSLMFRNAIVLLAWAESSKESISQIFESRWQES